MLCSQSDAPAHEVPPSVASRQERTAGAPAGALSESPRLRLRLGIQRLSASNRREEPMPPHKFKVGDIVALKPAVSRNVPGGVFEVTKQLPGTREPEYRIKSATNRTSALQLKASFPKLRQYASAVWISGPHAWAEPVSPSTILPASRGKR